MKKLMAILFFLTLGVFSAYASHNHECPCCPPDNGGGQEEGDCYEMGDTEGEAECAFVIGVSLPGLALECDTEEIPCILVTPGAINDDDYELDFQLEGAMGYDLDYTWTFDDDELTQGALTITYDYDAPDDGTLSNSDGPDGDGLGETEATVTVFDVDAPAGFPYGDYYLYVTLHAEYADL